MKKVILTILALQAFLGLTSAQVGKAGFGNFFIGPALNINSSVRNDLRRTILPGSDVQLTKVGLYLGGAGYSVRTNGIVLGGSGVWGRVLSDVKDAEIILENGSFLFNLGYCFLNKKNQLGFPYIGLGWHDSKLKISNLSKDEVFIIGRDTIGLNETGEFKNEGFAFEAGYAFRYLLSDEETNGKVHSTLLGFDAGATFYPALNRWRSGTDIAAFRRPFIALVYVRIAIGFGSYRKVEVK